MLALFMRTADHAQRRSIVYCGKRTGVAVMQHHIPFIDQGCAVLSHTLVNGDIFISDALRLCQQVGARRINAAWRCLFQPLHQQIHRPRQVDCRWSCRLQHCRGCFQLAHQQINIRSLTLVGCKRQPERGRRADRRGAADGHISNGAGDRAVVMQLSKREFPRDFLLVDHADVVTRPLNSSHQLCPYTHTMKLKSA
ncbi:hypothetical protein QPK87_34885 [Kamptonema cortianum]|nr:hypothetical protein [Kamptonema cortianum]